ncbi:MAG: hypothetical protein FJX72_16690, partial [Armatimonadetes bacterium]|nr:hypothetical protein [Armatimonadota bacterium]
MDFSDALNQLGTGYARGQAQYAANEEARRNQAEAAAKAAKEAAEFRLKLVQHDQTLRNSAEAEWKAITDMMESEDWR